MRKGNFFDRITTTANGSPRESHLRNRAVSDRQALSEQGTALTEAQPRKQVSTSRAGGAAAYLVAPLRKLEPKCSTMREALGTADAILGSVNGFTHPLGEIASNVIHVARSWFRGTDNIYPSEKMPRLIPVEATATFSAIEQRLDTDPRVSRIISAIPQRRRRAHDAAA